MDPENWDHGDIEKNPANELLRIEMRRCRKYVSESLEAGKHCRQDDGDAETACPRLDRKPDQAENNSLDDGDEGSVWTPDISRNNREADVPFSTCVTIEDRDQADDNLADQGSHNNLPDTEAGGDKRSAQLPVGY